MPVMTATLKRGRYSPGEEIANSVIHGLGILLAIGGLATMAAFAAVFGTVRHIVGCSLFGATLILLYTTSTLYHGIQHPGAKSVLRVLDHSAIFLLIAGTYTPFSLVNLRGPWGWSLFGVIWGLAAAGIIFKLIFTGRLAIVSVSLYVAMGWAVLVAVKPLVASVAAGGLALLVSGGLAYTLGIIFYAWRSLPFSHAVWHLFVLAGSTLHFFAVLFYVIPFGS